MIPQVSATLFAVCLSYSMARLEAAAVSPLPPTTQGGAAERGATAVGREEASDLFDRLLRRSAQIRDFRARFSQQLVSRGLNPPPPETGRVYYLRPYRMRWEYVQPEEKLAISDGVTGWLFLPEEKRVLKMSLAASVGGGPLASLLSGGEEARKAFRAEPMASEVGTMRLRLVPTSTREDFVALEVRAQLSTLTIREVQVVDPGENRMIYRFADMEEDVGLPVTLFTFTPPPGVEVAEQ